MKTLIALAVCLSLAEAASAARIEAAPVSSNHVTSSAGLSAELHLSEDGSRALARLSHCREDARDWPQQCRDAVTYSLTELTVDKASRTITHDGQVVARWSRFGRFVRLEPSYRLKHEVVTETDAAVTPQREIRRAKLFLERI